MTVTRDCTIKSNFFASLQRRNESKIPIWFLILNKCWTNTQVRHWDFDGYFYFKPFWIISYFDILFMILNFIFYCYFEALSTLRYFILKKKMNILKCNLQANCNLFMFFFLYVVEITWIVYISWIFVLDLKFIQSNESI